ncbi:MAG: cytochrome c [Candidatus Methylomirabilales bacterium]
MKSTPVLATLFLILAGGGTGESQAANSPRRDPAAVVAERRRLMVEAGTLLQEIWDRLAQDDLSGVATAAAALAKRAGRWPGLFPPESFVPPSRALPIIRDRFPEFRRLSEGLHRAAADLGRRAAAGERKAVVAGLPRLARACRECHRAFVQDPF